MESSRLENKEEEEQQIKSILGYLFLCKIPVDLGVHIACR